jgi:hypothetical protein
MWNCPKCGAEEDDGFVCWSCGTTSDGKLDPTFSRSDEEIRAVALAEPGPAADDTWATEAQAAGNGSPIARGAAGVLALLFAWVLGRDVANGKLAELSTYRVLQIAAFVVLFGWYAVRGTKGLPRFLKKKLGG